MHRAHTNHFSQMLADCRLNHPHTRGSDLMRSRAVDDMARIRRGPMGPLVSEQSREAKAAEAVESEVHTAEEAKVEVGDIEAPVGVAEAEETVVEAEEAGVEAK